MIELIFKIFRRRARERTAREVLRELLLHLDQVK
jgi:hypothetical protein